MAIVQVNVRAAIELLKSQHIEISWGNCRVLQRVVVTCCYSCFGYGRLQRGMDRIRTSLSIQYRKKSHLKNDCKTKQKCFLFTGDNGAPELLSHIPGSDACQVFIQALAKTKKILKGNLHRSRTVDDLLMQLRQVREAGLLMISKPYKNRDRPGWYADTLGDEFLYITERVNTVLIKRHFPNLVCIIFF